MMKKWLVGALLVSNFGFFAYMQWGTALTLDAHTTSTQAALLPEKMQLIDASTPPPKAVSAVVAVAAVTITPPSPSLTPTTICMEWGDFSGESLSRAEKSLAALKLTPPFGQRSTEHINGYWVYISPLRTSAEVEKKVAQLKGRGVTDYFVVQDEGKWFNAISLGVFKTQEAAQKYLASLKTKDVRTAQVAEHLGKEKFTVFELNHLDAATTEKVQKLSKEFTDSTLKTLACH